MKRLLPCLLLLALASGCTNDPDQAEFAVPRIEEVTITPGADYSEVILTCKVSATDGLTEFGFRWGEEEIIPTEGIVNNAFTARVSGLEFSKSYPYRAFVGNGRTRIYSETGTWKVEDETPPAPVIVKSAAMPGANAGKVSFRCRISLWEKVVGKDALRCGICYSADLPEPTLANAVAWADKPSAEGEFSLSLEGLIPSVEYHFRPFTQIGTRTTYGEMQDLRIPSGKEVVVTGAFTALTATSVTLSGTLNWEASIGELQLYGFEVGNKVLPGGTADDSGVYTLSLSDLSPETSYSYRAIALVGDVRYYGETRSFRTQSLPPEPEVDYVDLGLSVLWAKCDLGASEPGKDGAQYAWGETSPKATYTWANYKWCLGGPESLFKYTLEFDCTQADGKQHLEPEDDAAAVNLGGKWRMPTGDEWGELILNTRLEESGGAYILYSTQEGHETHSILFPEFGHWTTDVCGGASWGADMVIPVTYDGIHLKPAVIDIPSQGTPVLSIGGTTIDAWQLSRCFGYHIRPVRDR